MTNQEYLISCANTLVEFMTCELNHYITFEPLKLKQIGDSLQLYVNDTILQGTYLKLEETNTINGFELFGYFRDEKLCKLQTIMMLKNI